MRATQARLSHKGQRKKVKAKSEDAPGGVKSDKRIKARTVLPAFLLLPFAFFLYNGALCTGIKAAGCTLQLKALDYSPL
jgi:hypothetical protein